MLRRYVLLDRDGTINVDRGYLANAEQLELLPRAAEGLKALSRMGLGLIVVSNQSGIGRGYFDERALEDIHARLRGLLDAERVSLDGIYYCPHSPDVRCACRKPARGLVDRAAADFGFDPRSSFVIGDKPCDVQLGWNIGATTLLVRGSRTDNTAAEALSDFMVNDLGEAAETVRRLIESTGNTPFCERSLAAKVHG